MAQHKVVFHIDEPSKGRAEQVLTNIENLLNDMGDQNVEVELLANGGGVRSLVKDAENLTGKIEELSKRRVRFVACQNSFDHLNIQRSDLLETVDVVSAGVSELVVRQNQGWAYIRP